MFNRPKPIDVTSPLWRLEGLNPDTDTDGPLALLRLVVALCLRHRLVLAASSVAGFLLAGIYGLSLPSTYTSVATLLLEPRQSVALGQDLNGQQGLDLNRADSELQTIRSERLLSSVFESLSLQNSPELGKHSSRPTELTPSTLRLSVTPSQLGTEKGSRQPASGEVNLVTDAQRAAFVNFSRRLVARRVGQSFVIEVEYSSADPAVPARVANAVVSGYIYQAIALKEQIARAGTEALQGRLDSLSSQMEAARIAMREGALPSIPTPDADARVIGAALRPLGPSAPRKTLIAALGGILGLLGGIGFIAARMAFDRKAHNAPDLSRDSGIACLGSIPMAPSPEIPLKVEPRHLEYVSAIHNLRTSLEIASTSRRSDQNMAIAFVSWSSGAGVSSVSRSLAQLISRSGRRTTLFKNSLDLHTNSTEPHLGCPASLVDIALADFQFENFTIQEADGLVVFPIHSRDKNANLFTDFRNSRIQMILDAARLQGDVIFDLPALHETMDAMALCAYADAVVVVVAAEETTIEEVTEAVQLLRRRGANVIGTVLNKALQ